MNTPIETSLYKILANVLETDVLSISSIDTNQLLSEYGLDSLGTIKFIVKIEETFNIELSDDSIIHFYNCTFNTIINMLKKYIADSYTDSLAIPIPTKKILILDCDNVLWSGIAGEEPLTITSEHILFHNELLKLYNNGVILCLCSKNRLTNIVDAFHQLDLLINLNLFTYTKINYINKAQNIKEIIHELNVSPNSIVFIDDSEYEIGLINTFLPEVTTLHAKTISSELIQIVHSFFGDTPSSLPNRSNLYSEQKKREKEKNHFKTIDDYNMSLNTKITFCQATLEDSDRISELSLRTNQFNLSCCKYTPTQIEQFIGNNKYSVYKCIVEDKYGFMGIVGVTIIKEYKDCFIIQDFMLSCRAFNRKIENEMLNHIISLAQGKIVLGRYIPSQENSRFQNFYTENGVQLI